MLTINKASRAAKIKESTDYIRKLLRRSYAEERGPHGRTLRAVEAELDKIDRDSRRVLIIPSK